MYFLTTYFSNTWKVGIYLNYLNTYMCIYIYIIYIYIYILHIYYNISFDSLWASMDLLWANIEFSSEAFGVQASSF